MSTFTQEKTMDAIEAMATTISAKQHTIDSLYKALDELQRMTSDIPAIVRNERFAVLRQNALRALSEARTDA